MSPTESDFVGHRMHDGSLVRLESVSFGKTHRVPRESTWTIPTSDERYSNWGAKLPETRSRVVPQDPVIDIFYSYKPTILFSVCHLISENGWFTLQAFGISAKGEEFPIFWRIYPDAVRIDRIDSVQNRRMRWRGHVPSRILEIWEFPMPPAVSPFVEVRLYPGILFEDEHEAMKRRRQYTTLTLPNSRQWRQRSEEAERIYIQQQKRRQT